MLTTARLQQSLATACEQGEMCVHDRSGHQLSAIQWRLATATPSGSSKAALSASISAGIGKQQWAGMCIHSHRLPLYG